MNVFIDLYRRHKEVINYLIVGGLTTVVSLGVYYACVLTFLNPDNALQLQAANVRTAVEQEVLTASYSIKLNEERTEGQS